jgi:hypothetical protein
LEKKKLNIDPDIRIREIASNKTKDIWPKTALHIKKYKEKWEKAGEKMQC